MNLKIDKYQNGKEIFVLLQGKSMPIRHQSLREELFHL